MLKYLPWEFWGMLCSALIVAGIWFERWRQMDIEDQREITTSVVVSVIYMTFVMSLFHLIGFYQFFWE